jgi:hypothetical protein
VKAFPNDALSILRTSLLKLDQLTNTMDVGLTKSCGK